MSNLKTLRNAKKRLREDFERKKRIEWLELVAETDARIQLEVNRMHKDGFKVAAIMREYGTSDRKTITDLLFTQSNTEFAAVLGSALTWTHLSENKYEVTDGKERATIVALPDEETLIVLTTTNFEFSEGVTFEHYRAAMEASGSL